MSKTDELAKLFELKKQGILTEEEFTKEKAKILADGIATPATPAATIQAAPTVTNNPPPLQKTGNQNWQQTWKPVILEILTTATKPVAQIPLWVAWGVQVLAWVIFQATHSHPVEAFMGLACAYVGLVAIVRREEDDNAKYLIFVAFGDAIWMFYWASDGLRGL